MLMCGSKCKYGYTKFKDNYGCYRCRCKPKPGELFVFRRIECFQIANFPFLISNIIFQPAYDVFISQFIRFSQARFLYGCFTLRATRLSNKLLEQGDVRDSLLSSHRRSYGRYGDLIIQCEVPLSWMTNGIL